MTSLLFSPQQILVMRRCCLSFVHRSPRSVRLLFVIVVVVVVAFFSVCLTRCECECQPEFISSAYPNEDISFFLSLSLSPPAFLRPLALGLLLCLILCRCRWIFFTYTKRCGPVDRRRRRRISKKKKERDEHISISIFHRSRSVLFSYRCCCCFIFPRRCFFFVCLSVPDTESSEKNTSKRRERGKRD